MKRYSLFSYENMRGFGPTGGNVPIKLFPQADPKIKQKIMGKNNGMFGKYHSSESKEKMSKAKLGKSVNMKYTSAVICVELNKIYDNTVAAGKEMHLDQSSILKVCRNERKTCGGYSWKFININKEII